MSRLGGIGISASMSGLSARNAAIANMAQQLMQGAQFWAAMQEQRDEARRQRKWQEDQQKKAKKEAQKERWTGAGIGAGAGAAAGVLLAPLTAGASLAAVPAFGTVGSATAGTVGTIGATAGGAAAAGGLSAGGGALLGGVMGAAGGYMGNPTAGASFVQQAQQNAYGNQMAQQQMGMQQERLGMAREELGFRRSRFERENRPISEIAPGAFLPGDMGPPSPNAAMTPPPWQEAGLSPMTTLGEYRDYAEANRDIAYANRPLGGGRGMTDLDTILSMLSPEEQQAFARQRAAYLSGYREPSEDVDLRALAQVADLTTDPDMRKMIVDLVTERKRRRTGGGSLLGPTPSGGLPVQGLGDAGMPMTNPPDNETYDEFMRRMDQERRRRQYGR